MFLVALREGFRERLDDFYGFHAHADDLADESHDVLLVVFAVGVAFDAAALVLVDLIPPWPLYLLILIARSTPPQWPPDGH